LQTESASVQNSVDARLIQAVPNITRNPFYYATLQAGVVPVVRKNFVFNGIRTLALRASTRYEALHDVP